MKDLCKFSKIKRKSLISPIIVEFQNGDIIEEKLSNLKVKLTPNEDLTDKAVEVTSPDGQAFQSYSLSSSTFPNNYIAVRNRKTNKVKLVEVEYATIINSLFLRKEETSSLENDYKKQSSTLKKMFGTRRSIKQMEHNADLELDVTIMENQIKEVTDAVVPDTLIKVEKESSCLSLLPTCNREAKEVSEVYHIEDCLSSEELSSLSSTASEICDTKIDTLTNFSEFFRTCLKEAMKSGENLEAKVACLLYADCLLKYVSMPTKNLKSSSNEFCPYSKLVNNKIISEFCTRSGHLIQRSLMLKDKALCHIMVLSLLATNFTVDVQLVAKHAAVGVKKMMQIARTVGAVPKGRGSNEFILKLPLPPPPKVPTQNRRSKGS